MGTMYSGTEESLLPSQSRMEPPLRSKAATSENSSSCLDNTVWPDSDQNLLAVMLSPLYGECHTSGKRLQPVTQISLCQISVGKSVCNGFPERLGFRTSLEITFWAIPKQSHSRVSPSTLTTKRSSPLLSAYAPFSRLGDKFLDCLFLRRVLHLFIVQCQWRHRRRNICPQAAKGQAGQLNNRSRPYLTT